MPAKSSEDLRKRAEELKRQYQKIEREAKKQARLEEQKKREAEERVENAMNRRFVEFTKTLPANKDGTTVYDYVMLKMNGKNGSAKASASNTTVPGPDAFQQNPVTAV